MGNNLGLRVGKIGLGLVIEMEMGVGLGRWNLVFDGLKIIEEKHTSGLLNRLKGK